jgi:hypothetical protein
LLFAVAEEKIFAEGCGGEGPSACFEWRCVRLFQARRYPGGGFARGSGAAGGSEKLSEAGDGLAAVIFLA